MKSRYFGPLAASAALHVLLLSTLALMVGNSAHIPRTIQIRLYRNRAPAAAGNPAQPDMATAKMTSDPVIASASEAIHSSGNKQNQDCFTAFALTKKGEPSQTAPLENLQAGILETQISYARRAKPKDIVRPPFTRRAFSMGITGEVVLGVVVGPDGLVKRAQIKKPLGFGLDEEALNAMYRSTFDPARNVKGQPVDDEIDYRFKFEIKDGTG